MLKLLFNMREKIVLEVDGKMLHLVLKKSYDEWLEACGWDDRELWDFPIEELLDGTVDINEDIWYWLIGGRCYETYEEA